MYAVNYFFFIFFLFFVISRQNFRDNWFDFTNPEDEVTVNAPLWIHC